MGQGEMSFRSCYYREGIQLFLKEGDAAVVVISPCLPGTAEIIELIRQIRVSGRRVVLLPGPKTDESTVQLARKAVGLGVYDIIFDPVRPSTVIHRISNPANLGDAGIEPDSEPAENIFFSEEKGKKGIRQAVGRLFKRKKKNSPVPDFQKTDAAPPETDAESDSLDQTAVLDLQFAAKAAAASDAQDDSQRSQDTPEISQMHGGQSKTDTDSKPGLFSRLIKGGKQNGVIDNSDFIEKNWDNVRQVETGDAVVIPASWGIMAVREFRRDPRFRATPLVVIGGRREHLQAGADMIAKRISPKVIEEAEFLSRRYREFWQRAEFDSLTGLFKKDFLLEWISEQEKRPEPNFSVAMIDIDHFKSFNDTYGHQAGDAVLTTFGAFLKSQIRSVDIAARYGGEEFVIGLPNTLDTGAQVLIDRLRKNWAEREIILPSGEKVRCTFSAGIAGYKKDADVIAEADKFLYKAKNEGRNRVEGVQSRRFKVLFLGQQMPSLGPLLLEQGFDVATDPADAAVVVADVRGYTFAPADKPLVVLGTGTIADFAVKKSRLDAKIVRDPENIVDVLLEMFKKPKPAKKLMVLPGGRSERGQSLALYSALYIVCPSRPGQAGEVAARLARDIEDCALVCAAPESTGALALGIPENDLICADWRIPGSDAPIKWGGMMVWPVDPFKFLNVKDISAHALVEQIKSKFSLVIVDCAGNLEIASRAPKTDGIIVLHREGDAADAATSHWLKSYAGNNVIAMSPSEVPDLLQADDGFVVVKKSGLALDFKG